MKRSFIFFYFLILALISSSCLSSEKSPVPGANQMDQYKHLIEGKSVAVVANQTSMVRKTHLVDTLLRIGINVSAIFAPEHGFRDLADAGDQILDGKDIVTGVRIISLYGGHLKPTPDDLKGIDIVLFDIQDVGVRFYTYISTLHYVLEACAENNVKCIVLDRPTQMDFIATATLQIQPTVVCGDASGASGSWNDSK